jgi:hypothetical protein
LRERERKARNQRRYYETYVSSMISMLCHVVDLVVI